MQNGRMDGRKKYVRKTSSDADYEDDGTTEDSDENSANSPETKPIHGSRYSPLTFQSEISSGASPTGTQAGAKKRCENCKKRTSKPHQKSHQKNTGKTSNGAGSEGTEDGTKTGTKIPDFLPETKRQQSVPKSYLGK